MRSLQDAVGVGRTKALSSPTGLAGWLLNRLSSAGAKRQTAEKQMQLLETLPLSGKQNLMLVSCAGELFLVGGSFEGIESIVRIQGESSRNVAVKVDGSCS